MTCSTQPAEEPLSCSQLQAGVCRKPQSSGKYQGWLIDMNGRRKFFVGTRSKPETRRMAQRFEDEHRQVRLGYHPPPRPSDRPRMRSITENMKSISPGGSTKADVEAMDGVPYICTSARRTSPGGNSNCPPRC